MITLLAVCSFRFLWSIFQDQAFLGFPLQSFVPSKKPCLFRNLLLSCTLQQSRLAGREIVRCFKALLFSESCTRKHAVKRIWSRYSPGFFAFEVLLQHNPSDLLQAATSLVLSCHRKRQHLHSRVLLLRWRIDAKSISLYGVSAFSKFQTLKTAGRCKLIFFTKKSSLHYCKNNNFF